MTARPKTLAVAATVIILGCARFPSRASVDEDVSRLASAPAGKERVMLATKLFEEVRDPSSTEQDAVARLALEAVGDVFLRTSDVSVLEALDRVRLEGGFANDACELYVRVLRSESAREWYRASGDLALRRCVGLSFSADEIERLLAKGSVPE